MYTSYFAQLKNIKNPIAICGKSPSWYKGSEYRILAPKFWFFDKYKKGEIDSEEYTKFYNAEVLSNLNPAKVYNDLFNFYKTEDFTLLCYEAPNDFCHRHLVSKWFNDNGYNIEELKF